MARGTCFLPDIHDPPGATQLISLVILYLNLVTFSDSIPRLPFTFWRSEGWGRKSGKIPEALASASSHDT